MTQIDYLVNRLNEVFLNGKFIANTNFKTQIEQVSFEDANYKIANLNTIAMLTFHINYYLQGVNEVFEGKDLTIKDQNSFEMPTLESELDWQILKNTFLNNVEKFINHIKKISDIQLDEPFVNEKYGTFARNIDAMIEHSYYHLGQIVLIKKMIINNN